METLVHERKDELNNYLFQIDRSFHGVHLQTEIYDQVIQFITDSYQNSPYTYFKTYPFFK